MQLPVTGVPWLVVVLPPRALETNTCADVPVDVTARSQGPTMFLLVMVSTGVPWSFSTIRHPAGFRPGSAPPVVVGRLPTTTQPPGRMPSAVVRPTPPGQAIPAGSLATSANRLVCPAGDTWTMVLPVPWTLALSLKLLTRTLPAVSRPAEAGTTASPYGFTSPSAGTVEAICDPAWSWPRKDMAGAAAAFALEVAGVLGVEVVELDAQAVVTRPRPSMAVRTTAWCRGPTVLPLPEGPRPPWSTE